MTMTDGQTIHEAQAEAGYVTESRAGHEFEDELANNPPKGEAYDWYERLLRATIDGELTLAGNSPSAPALARAIMANYGYIFQTQPRPTPLAIAEQLLDALRRDTR